MKQGSFKAVCLVLLAAMAVGSAFGDDITVNSESRILESFDGDSPYVWKVTGSKFATKLEDASWPQSSLIASWPQALFGINREGKELKSLGVWGRFDRQGYNWIDVYPAAADGGDDAGPAEIPIPGRLQNLDIWVWGSNLSYTLEAYFRDLNGVVHTITVGNLNFQGWKNLQARIPTGIPQARRGKVAPMTFIKFRIWTPPIEPVNDFRIYFDQFKILTDTFESLYDGNELAMPERVQELWNGQGQQ
ncbi:membrane protein [Spirochaetia bacterium]|nr:membrane protein [Spirochaetia bacterium]